MCSVLSWSWKACTYERPSILTSLVSGWAPASQSEAFCTSLESRYVWTLFGDANMRWPSKLLGRLITDNYGSECESCEARARLILLCCTPLGLCVQMRVVSNRKLTFAGSQKSLNWQSQESSHQDIRSFKLCYGRKAQLNASCRRETCLLQYWLRILVAIFCIRHIIFANCNTISLCK